MRPFRIIQPASKSGTVFASYTRVGATGGGRIGSFTSPGAPAGRMAPMLSIRTTAVASAIALSAFAGVGSTHASPRGHIVVRHRPQVFVYGGYGFYHWYPGFYDYSPPYPYGYYGY